MTNQELNRDIKRMYKSYLKTKNNFDTSQHDDYFEYIDKVLMKEYMRLYDSDGIGLNLLSLQIMLSLNSSHRFVTLHMFYIGMKVNV